MTHKERFIATLKHQPITGRVPHFELVFYLTQEAFGRPHPSHRNYGNWDQMTESERQTEREDCADLYIKTAERFEHDAIFLHPNPGSEEESMKLIDVIREKTGDEYFLMMHGDATYSIPAGSHMTDWIVRLVENPDAVKADADRMVDGALQRAERYKKHGGIDGWALCADYCFNDGPFLRPEWFAEFVTPYLTRLNAGCREIGHYTIKHTDGNIMPILDQLAQTEPHALHSLDPQAGVDIAVVKKMIGDKLCLIGNVN